MEKGSTSRLTSSIGGNATSYADSTIMASPRADATCYDVFLSFRWEDTRDSFTDHLYEALRRAGFLTFRDNDGIEKGRKLKPEIQRAIKASKASIVVLSENYATSTWCLEELSLILEQRREFNQFVLPVFYHVDPSDVRKQDKTFKIEVKTSSKWTFDKLNRWKAALTKVADLTGFVRSGYRLETKFLKEVVDTIYNELECKKVRLPPYLTGMDSRYEEITPLLNQANFQYLAICGMAGSGKTTLAKYIYNSNWKRFENISFVEDINSRCKGPRGFLELQEQLLKDILGGRKRKTPSVSHGPCKIEEALLKKRALIVLDDIVEYSELVALLGTGKINPESKIIITTENSYLWSKFPSRCRYEMKLLNDAESLELFSCHAFGSKVPVDHLKKLAAQAARYCEGNPLAIEVLGSSLSNCMTIPYWKSQLEVLKKDIHSRIHDVLERSYNSLPYNSQKELFLHIACFFIGKDMDYVAKILEPDYSAVSGIKTLTNRFLLSVSSSNKLMMHRLLQEMGRNIVRKESLKFPEKRSRVWHSAESYKILKKGRGSKTIEGLALDMQMLKEEDDAITSLDLKTDALKKMDKLKYLQLNAVEVTGSYENFSEDLRWLCWFRFHLRTIPSDLFMGNLVAIDLSYSNLEVFEPPMVLRSLHILNLKDSHSLLEIRNISRIPHLETLILWNCHSLVRVCETMGDLTSLTLLNMTGCINLCKKKQLNLLVALEASTSGGQDTKQPPLFFPHSLQRLFLKDCHLECTDSFPLNFSVQPSLQYLNLGNSLFEFLPYYDHLKNLRVLDLSLCSRLKWLLCLPSTLAELYVYYCVSLEMITFQSHLFTLQEFGYEGCISLSEIEGFIKLIPIAKLDETDLGHMKWLKEYQNQKVRLVGDDELTIGRSLHLQMLYEFDIMSTSLPDIKISNTTPEYISESPYLSFDVPSCPKNKRLKGLNVTFKYTLYGDDWAWFAKISTTNGVGLMYNPKVFGNPGFGEVGIWLSYWPIGNKLDVGDKVIVSIVLLSGLVVTECGASLVYADDEEVDETLERNMGCAEALGGDLSGFQLSTGAYYLCRRDFVELMEVGRLAFDWFRVLVGDTIDYTEVRGWRNTGRPKQSKPSFTELKTVRCIIDGPELEEIYKIVEMSKSSLVDKTVEFPSSSILRETIKSGTTSKISDATTKEKSGSYNLETTAMSKGESEFAETTEFASIPHNEKLKRVVSDENVEEEKSGSYALEATAMSKGESEFVETTKFASIPHNEKLKRVVSHENVEQEKSGGYNLETTAMSKGESEFAETTEFASIPHNEKLKRVVSDENVEQATDEEKLHSWYVASHVYFDDGEHDDDDDDKGPRHMDEGPSHMYEGSHPSYNMPPQMPYEGGQFPPCFPHEYFTPYWTRLSKCETGVTCLREQNKKDTTDIIHLKERYKFHHNRYENLDGRLKKLERFRQDFENLTVSSSACGEQPGAEIDTFFSSLFGESTMPLYGVPPPMMTSMPSYNNMPMLSSVKETEHIGANFVSSIFGETTMPCFSHMLSPQVGTMGITSELAFHTPTTNAEQIPPKEPMGRGFRIRKTALVQGIPYTQQGSTTLPKWPKGKGKEEEENETRKKEKDAYLRLLWKRRPAKESVVVALYWQEELQEGQQLRCLPYDTVGPNWWKILLGLDGQGWYFNTHIEAWLRYILASRPNHAPWTIMVPDFWTYMSSGTVDGPSHGYGAASGNLANENFPAWSTITRVLMPICIDEKHWVLGIMNIESMRMTIHDTLGVEHLQQELYGGFAIFQHSLKLLFERLDDPLRAARAEHLSITFALDTPRQSGHLGDCGPWICRFLSQFTDAVNLPPVIDPEQTMLDFRHQMADTIWKERIG